jgi:hypothetical protein
MIGKWKKQKSEIALPECITKSNIAQIEFEFVSAMATFRSPSLRHDAVVSRGRCVIASSRCTLRHTGAGPGGLT